MDVVHVSEWRGSGYLCLLAKRQGIAFARTLFVVKTSSPWMWNRLYGSHALEKAEDLVKIHAERCSVELADVVVGGSLHLLRWMVSQGYAVPRERAFVQPNVVTFTALQPLIRRRALPHGQRTPIDEIVFFGRLESRKGLFVFCQAIRRLIRKGVKLPARITFMGKPGSRLPSHPDQDTPDYIRETSQDWPTEVQILSNFQQYEAIEYLLGGKRLAVMPSIIENSSLAIYEAAICAIPTVATNVGGNAELIAQADHAAVLCAPHPVALGDKLEEALALGGMVPTPSFDNDANLETWRSFHRQLRASLRQKLLDASLPPVSGASPLPASSVAVYYLGDAAALERTLASLAGLSPRTSEVVVGVDAASNSDCDVAAAMLEKHGFKANVVQAFDLDAGLAFNRMAERATGEYLLFLWEGACLQPGALGQLGGVARATGADVLNYFNRVVEPGEQGPHPLTGQVIVGVGDSFFRTETRELPLFVNRAGFLRLGGFTTDYRVLGYDHEYVAKAQLAGANCQTVMQELGSIQARSPDWLRLRGYDLAASSFRAIRPKLAATPLAMRDTLLLARGMHARSGPAGKAKSSLDAAPSPEGLLARLMIGIKQEEAAPKGKAGVRKPAVARTSVKAPAVAISPPRINIARIPSSTVAIERETERALRQMVAKAHAPSADAKRLDAAATPPASATGTRKPGMSSALKALVVAHGVVSDGVRVGQLLGAHGNQLYGWVTQLGSPGGTLEVELIVDGRRRAGQLQPADRSFAPFAVLPAEAARRGFVFDLPILPARARGGIAYAVAVCGSDLILGEGLVLPQNATLGTSGIDAGCAPDTTGIIHGWARSVAEPGRKLDVALFANDVFMGRCHADLPREEGACGFALPVPGLLRKAGRHRIDVRIVDLGLIVPGAPMWVEGAQVTITPARAKRRAAA
jgi:glycosyltransferase involved in cell wall biosynthesis